MPISGTRRMMVGGWGNPKLDLKDPSLVLYLPLWYPDSETTGSTIISKDINRHSCTVTGATWGSQGRIFNGTDDIITILDHASLDLTTGCSLVIGIKLTATPSQYDEIIIKGGDIYEINFNNADALTVPQFYLTCASGAIVRVGVALTLNVWYHLVGAYSATGGAILYTNTSPSSTTAQKGNITTDNNSLTIGGSATRKLPAQIGEIRIYNRALTAVEVRNDYLVTKWRYQ